MKAESVPKEYRQEPRGGKVSGSASVAPVSPAYRFTRKRSASLGSSGRHETEPVTNGKWHLCLVGVSHPTSWRPGYLTAPVSPAFRFTRKRFASLGSSGQRETEPIEHEGRHHGVTVSVPAVFRGLGGIDLAAPASTAHRFTSKRVTASLGSSTRFKPEPLDDGRLNFRAKGSAATAVISETLNRGELDWSMEPPFPPLPLGGESPNVAIFLPTDITAYAPAEVITRLLPENAVVTHPLCGPIFYDGQSAMASKLLGMYCSRSSSNWKLLVTQRQRSVDDQLIMSSGARHSALINASMGIDNALGESIKVGPAGRYQEIKVDRDGRTRREGTSIFLFHLQLKNDGLGTAPLVRDSLQLITRAGNMLLPTDPLVIQQWPGSGDMCRLLMPAVDSAVSFHLMHSRQPLHEATAEVRAALTAIGMENRTDFVIFRDTHEETDVVVLFTLNTKLLAFLLVTCPNFGSVGSAMLRPGFSLIRELPPKAAGSDGERNDVEMRTDGHEGRATVPSSSMWSQKRDWANQPPRAGGRAARGMGQLSREPLLPEHLLQRLPGDVVFQRDPNWVGPSPVISFPYNCMHVDYDQVIGEVAFLLIEYMATRPDANPRDLEFERWKPDIGALYTWTPQGRRLCRILVRVQPGLTFLLVVEALNGQSLSIDPEQTLFPQPTLCMCKGCQQHLLDETGYGCVSCAAKDHLAGAAHCPRQLARRSQLLRKRELALTTAASSTQTAYRAKPTATPSPLQERPPGVKLPTLQEEAATESEDSDDEDLSPQNVPELPKASGSKEELHGQPSSGKEPHGQPSSGEAHHEQPKVPTSNNVSSEGRASSSAPVVQEPSSSAPEVQEPTRGGPGRGRGGGRGEGGRDGGRGQSKGRGGGKEIIPWLCPFCHQPTGTEALHNSKTCNRPLKLPPPAGLQWARCAICNHSHPWMECPIMYDSRLGFSVIPLPFIAIAERMGYQTLMVGNRKTISVTSLLPQMPGKTGSRGGSTSSSQSSLALSSVSDMSTTVIDGVTQEALSIVRQQGQEILGQVSSLKDVVTELSSGQQALYTRQSELQGQLATQAATSLKLLTAMSNIKEDFKTFKVEQEKSFAAEQAKYKETMDRLNELLAIEDSDVKGPLDGMESG